MTEKPYVCSAGIFQSISKDGQLLKAPFVGETASRKELLTLEHGASVWCVAFSPDGKMLAAGVDKDVKLWLVA